MRCDEIGVQVSRQEFVDFLNSVQGGQFFSIKGYTNAEGEKSDYILRYGIKYGNLVARDVQVLRDVLAGKIRSPLKVKHGLWVQPASLQTMFLSPAVIATLPDHKRAELVEMTISRDFTDVASGRKIPIETTGTVDPMDVFTLSNRKGQGKIPVTASYVIPQHHPLVVAAIGAEDLQGTLLQGLLNPREGGAEYNKEARSCYSKEGEENRWYIRDVLVVSKEVRVKGDYPFTASFPINAVKQAISKQWLLTGNYRQFILTDGQFESITIEGQAILCDGIDEQFFFALPEIVKEEARV